MCCFTKPVKSVSFTRIFARPDVDGRQFVVYSMTFRASQDLAMVLPLPVKAGSGEKAVRFIDLSGYPDFFGSLQSGFVEHSNGLVATGELFASAGTRKLEVIEVGEFEASYVPTTNDFSRLDERFRLPSATWNQLRDYRTYGFAVFKLKKGHREVHPMAFSFPRENPGRVFFPTVHIHDGKVHQTAKFDHILYCQPTESERLATYGWTESFGHARQFIDVKRAKGVIAENQHCYRKPLVDRLPNRDTFVESAI